jgi:hypothetical protein
MPWIGIRSCSGTGGAAVPVASWSVAIGLLSRFQSGDVMIPSNR